MLIVTDGNPGVLKAIEEVFPQSLKHLHQFYSRLVAQLPEDLPYPFLKLPNIAFFRYFGLNTM